LRRRGSMMVKLAAAEVSALDPYTFMATIGKRVIHPGGRTSTDLETETGPLEMMTPRGFLADEAVAHSLYLGYVVVAGEKLR
jgi:hypothetical protein